MRLEAHTTVFTFVPNYQLALTRITVYAGKDASRAFALSSLLAADCQPVWRDLDDVYKTVLSEWFATYSEKYPMVGRTILAAPVNAS